MTNKIEENKEYIFSNDFLIDWNKYFPEDDLDVYLISLYLGLIMPDSFGSYENSISEYIRVYGEKAKFIISYAENSNHSNNIRLFYKEIQDFINENCPLIKEYYHLELEHIESIYKFKDGVWRTILKRIEENISAGKRKERSIGLQLQTWLINHYEKGYVV